MPMVTCLGCDEGIFVSRSAKISDLVTCAECGAELAVVGTDPIKFDWADDSDYDYEEDEDGDD